MTPTHKTSLLIALIVIGILATTFFLFTNTFVSSAPEPFVPTVERKTQTVESAALFYVSAADAIVVESNDVTAEEAQSQCDALAFNTDYMWQQVVCVYDGEEIYNDIFVAG